MKNEIVYATNTWSFQIFESLQNVFRILMLLFRIERLSVSLNVVISVNQYMFNTALISQLVGGAARVGGGGEKLKNYEKQ